MEQLGENQEDYNDFYDWYFNDYLNELEKKYATKHGQREGVLQFEEEYSEIYKQKKQEIDSMHKIKKNLEEDIEHHVFELSRIQELKEELDFLFDVFWYDVKEMEKSMITAQRIYKNIKNPDNDNYDDLPVEDAKSVPIESLYDFQKVKRTAGRVACSCPFHKDDNPSFNIYTETNTFKCFSCQQGGDSIQFYMDINGVGFIQAVREITHQ